jgi:hypothetical protein
VLLSGVDIFDTEFIWLGVGKWAKEGIQVYKGIKSKA